MKSKFAWASLVNSDEIENTLKSSIISFDANVILDIYRVDKDTRKEIKQSIEQFKENIWLTHQAAYEITEDRSIVECNAKNVFKKYIDAIGKASSNLNNDIRSFQSANFTSNKEIQKEINCYLEQINSITRESSTRIKELGNAYKLELNDENILEWIYDLFDGKIGDPFEEHEIPTIHTEAQRRIDEKIPPGYKDAKKEIPNRYGDFCLWEELLKKSKKDNKPIVFVTSEKKEDWFEIVDNQILQPRRELLKEAIARTEQRFLLFRTESFLEKAARLRSGGEISESTEKAIEEIRNLRVRDGKVASIIQHEIDSVSSEYSQSGVLDIALKEPIYMFTITGKLEPNMVAPPRVMTALLEHPEEMPEPFRIRHGAGTCFDFNIHFKSDEYGKPLPAGLYKLEYTAECDIKDNATCSQTKD